MTDFAWCMFQEQGRLFAAGLMFIGVVGFIIWLFLTYAVLKHLFWSIGKPVSGWRFAITTAEKGIDTSGGGAIFLAAVTCLGAIGLLAWFLWHLYADYGQQYAPAIDSPSTPVTLASVREKLQPFSKATIQVAPEVMSFQIRGHFEGLCVPDLITSICRQYSSELECRSGWFDQKIEVLGK